MSERGGGPDPVIRTVPAVSPNLPARVNLPDRANLPARANLRAYEPVCP